MTEEMFKKNVQDLQKQLTEAYRRIKELSDEIAVQKKELTCDCNYHRIE